MKFAAIDIGSNAVRLLLARVIEDGDDAELKKEVLVRMPLRLGEDTFRAQVISEDKANRLVETVEGFRHLIGAYPATDYTAYATSAMREARNGIEVVERVRERTGIEVEIIDGRKEAEVIYANHIEDRLDPKKNYLYIDVGGGSTELTMIAKRRVVASGSFSIGTVRMLQNRVAADSWTQMEEWVKHYRAEFSSIVGIGSGGNINKIFKLARGKEGKPLSYGEIKDIQKWLKSFTLQERIVTLGLRPDRADVIIPAFRIYLSVMKWAKISRVYVPQFGLADGIVHLLYHQHRNGNGATLSSESA